VADLNTDRLRFLSYLLDFGRCQNGNCPVTRIDGPLRWSPDGSHAISASDREHFYPAVIDGNDGRWRFITGLSAVAHYPLYLGSGRTVATTTEAQRIGEGYGPFWVDDNTYGFLRAITLDEQELVLGQVGQALRRPIVKTSDLQQLLPDSDETATFELLHVAPHPTNAMLLFLVILERPAERAYLFTIDRYGGQRAFRFMVESSLQSLAFSPGGRYLVSTEHDERNAGRLTAPIKLLLHDVGRNHTTPFLLQGNVSTPAQAYDWSPDGQWLAFAPAENILTLIAPATATIRTITHEYGECNSMVWAAGDR
jgi:hypothetical protein